MKNNRSWLILVTILCICLTGNVLSQPMNQKTRIILLSDISGTKEPDDYQSFIRFLLYSNQFDVEGIIGAGSIYGPDRGDNKYFNEVIDGYGMIRNNLIKHAEGYPSVESLKSIVTLGQQGVVGMDNVGDDKDTPGSNLIIESLKCEDQRPIWISAWGGTGTLAQALWDLKYNSGLGDEMISQMLSKLRVYDIAGQDNSGGWIAKTFPELFYIRSSNQFLGMGEGHVAITQGGDLSIANDEWFRKNVMEVGEYGSLYPKRRNSFEGDSPAFIYLIQNGLSNPEQVNHGGWGGRFNLEKVRNSAARSAKVIENAYQDFYMYNDASDTWQYADTTYNNVYCAIYRWREAYQNDFKARMSWTHLSFEEANHNPVATVNGNQTKEIIRMDAKAGKKVKLNAGNSFDPDGDQLVFRWFYYKEPGTYDGDVKIENHDLEKSVVRIPKDASNKEIHIILELKDNGNPGLFSYRRVVIDVK